MKCEYGCGKDAKFTLKNGKRCCSKSPNSCLAIRAKNSKSQKENFVFTIRGQFVKRECKWCAEKIASTGIKKHEDKCYLNPKNLKLCPVCGDPIKHYKNNVTCSPGCANTYFRSGDNHPNWNGNSYRKKAIKHYPNKCENCKYDKHKEILEVHHIDGNRKNNSLENLIILCPNCHAALTRKYAVLEDRKLKWLDNKLFEI